MRSHIRSIKPEIFCSEKLWDKAQETGLPLLQAFAGLWCYADREGRFEWRPRTLRGFVLPFWDGDFGKALQALSEIRCIVRYVVDGHEYGFMPNWHDHQRINAREPASVIPAPPSTCVHVQSDAPHEHASREGRGEGREGEWEGRGSDDRAPESSPEVTEIRPATVPTGSIRPEPADAVPVVWRSIKGWEPPASLEDEAVMHNISREYFRDRVKRAQNKPIGGKDGVFSREQWVRDQFPFWVVDQRTQQPRAGPHGGPDDRLRKQADRVQMLREQEAAEEARQAGNR
jgi:hypothetical protein